MKGNAAQARRRRRHSAKARLGHPTGVIVVPFEVPAAVLEERARAYAGDTRDLTARAFGDPLPMRSALWGRA